VTHLLHKRTQCHNVIEIQSAGGLMCCITERLSWR